MSGYFYLLSFTESGHGELARSISESCDHAKHQLYSISIPIRSSEDGKTALVHRRRDFCENPTKQINNQRQGGVCFGAPPRKGIMGSLVHAKAETQLSRVYFALLLALSIN
ncbi:uncharacterized [Tachysurus ichikawai]